MTRTARDLPELRARTVAWCADPGRDGAANWLTCLLPPDDLATLLRLPAGTSPADGGATLARRLHRQFRDAELFYVAPDMTTLARHAAADLADYPLTAHDLPAPVGVMYYADPPGHLTTWHGPDHGPTPVSLVTWGPAPDGLGVVLWVPAAPDVLPTTPATDAPLPAHVDPATAPRQLVPPSGYRPHRLTTLRWDQPLGTPTTGTGGTDADDLAHHRTVAATWLLMGQTLVQTRTETAPRPARRRIARIDPDLPTAVRCVDLRRVRTAAPDDTTPTGRTYHHRWVVTGHWRRQWYPSQHRHRPIWIAPHLAGPDDAPLLGGDRVHVLRR